MLALLLVAWSPLLLAATDPSSYRYAASITRSDDAHSPAPPQPSPARPSPTLATAAPLYTTRGAIEVDTNENTLFMWHEKLYVLENM